MEDMEKAAVVFVGDVWKEHATEWPGNAQTDALEDGVENAANMVKMLSNILNVS